MECAECGAKGPVEFFYNYSTREEREAIIIEASGKAIEAWNKRV